ncbi:hypothetical protein ABPG75_005337 [Micractinium tetrahymenae]
MSWLKKDLRLIGATAEEEFYEALSSTPCDADPQAGAGGETEQGEWLSRSEEGSQGHFLALHRAAYCGDVGELRRLLPGLSLRQKLQLDPQGNTALHVAVLRHQHAAIAALLEGGLPPDVKNERRWNPVDEAVALGDAVAAKLLYSHLLASAKVAKRQKKAQLVAIMEQLPDFRMQLRWELGSPLFGLLLRHYAPDDTYTVYKVGNLLRVDGTLMGLDDRSRSFIPRWKRGRFSLLVDAGATPTAAFLVDHVEKVYYDLYRERKAHLKSIDEEVAEMLAEGAGKVRLADADVDFMPVKTWLGRPKTETVDGLHTEVYEASGSLVAATWEKAAVVIPPEASFEEYLDMELPADTVQEVPLDPLSPPEKPKGKPPAQQPTARAAAAELTAPAAAPAPLPAAAGAGPSTGASAQDDAAHASSSRTFTSASSGSSRSGSSAFSSADSTAGASSASTAGVSASASKSAKQAQQAQQEQQGQQAQHSRKHKKARSFSSRCWLARRYPITLAQVIPLLEVVAAGNRHFAQAATYLRQFQSDEYFPVRVQVPLVWTVYLLLSFRQFTLLGLRDPARQRGFFQVPSGYKLDRMEEGDLVQKKASPLLERLDSAASGELL